MEEGSVPGGQVRASRDFVSLDEVTDRVTRLHCGMDDHYLKTGDHSTTGPPTTPETTRPREGTGRSQTTVGEEPPECRRDFGSGSLGRGWWKVSSATPLDRSGPSLTPPTRVLSGPDPEGRGDPSTVDEPVDEHTGHQVLLRRTRLTPPRDRVNPRCRSESERKRYPPTRTGEGVRRTSRPGRVVAGGGAPGQGGRGTLDG